MRLSADAILAGLDHPDADVRTLALGYFTASYSTDPRVMPALIAAIEKYGADSLGQVLSEVGRLAQSEETIRWVLAQISRDGGGQPSTSQLRSVFFDIPAPLLRKLEREIADNPAVYDQAKTDLRDFVALSELPPEELWRQLENACGPSRDSEAEAEKPKAEGEVNGTEEGGEKPPLDGLAETETDHVEGPDEDEWDDEEWDDEDGPTDDDFDRWTDLARALGQHPEFVAERVRAVLRAAIANEPGAWEYPEFVARVAREARLTTAVPELVAALSTPNEFLNEEAEYALAAIGSDDAIESIRTDHLKRSREQLAPAPAVLAATHTDRSVEVALELAEVEDEYRLKCWFYGAALRAFDTRAIEPTRRFLLQSRDNRDSGSLRLVLLAACELMNERFPEFARWQDDVIRERQRVAKRLADLQDLLNRPLPDPPKPRKEPPSYQPSPIVRSEPKAGRNDPCPCGSGKKYKKCCWGKK